MTTAKHWAGLLTVALGISMSIVGCGGGESSQAMAPLKTQSGTLLPNMKRLSDPAATSKPYGDANPADAINQLLDFAETDYKQHFPSHQVTLAYERFFYRYHPQTQKYVGVAFRVYPEDGLIEGGYM